MLASLEWALFNNKMITKREAQTIEAVGNMLIPERRLDCDDPDTVHAMARNALLNLRMPFETRWHMLLPDPELSLALFEDLYEKHALFKHLGRRATIDGHYGCWSLPLTAEYDDKERARYPTIGMKQFGANGISAHRIVWKILLDPTIKRETHVDHLCRVHACFNPMHTEAVSAGMNTSRGHEARRRVNGQYPLFYSPDRW